MPKQKRWFWLAALAAAWFFDFLFWKKPFGVQFLVWTAALLGIGYLLAWRESKKVPLFSVILSILILAFSAISAWRSEPFTRMLSVMLSLAGMLLLTATFLNGYWPFYRLVDYVTEGAKALWGGLSRAILMGTRNGNPPPMDQPEKKGFWKRVFPVLRGLLIALPIVALLGVLLSSADPVFGEWIKKVLNLEKIPEYLFRLWYILLIGSFLVGIYLHAILPLKDESRPDTYASWMKPFLGWTETGIVLGAVDLLFLVFVFIQVRYLFGGTANINETGFTYADYARRGFGELVAVAVLSLLLYLGLNTISKRESKGARIGFTVVSVLLMANVLVILVSSLQRLMLYESAYGFSQLRTYTHVFIFWLGGLIVAAIVLELLKKRGHFALALIVCILGFSATLAIMNVDGFIVNHNVERALSGEKLDVEYLNTLTSDAVPAMVTRYSEENVLPKVKDALGAALACRTDKMEDPASRPWQGFILSDNLAYKLLQENKAGWSQFKVYSDDQLGRMVDLDGKPISCNSWVGMD